MFERVRSWFGGGSATVGKPAVRAAYDNARTTKENARNWQTVDYFSAKAANSYSVRRVLRTRSRHEVSNNPILFGVVNNNADDLIDSGPTLQMSTTNAKFNRAVETLWNEWCDEVGLAEKLRTVKLAKEVDGEGILLFKTVDELESPVKLYPCDVEADQMTTPSPQNYAEFWVDGLVLHPITGRPTKYHFLRSHPGDFFFPNFNPLEVDVIAASHVVHWFRKFRPGQVRGIPVFTSSLDLFTELRAFRKAVLGSAQIAASFAAVLESEYPPSVTDPAEDEPFVRVPIERDAMVMLPHGVKMSQFDPKQPTTTYDSFQEKCVGEGCRPLAYPLNLALGTSQKFNFSSAKLDHINYRGALTCERTECERVALNPLFNTWYREAVLSGAIPAYDGLEKVPPHEWHWPGFEPLDPTVDAAADHDRLANGTLTYREFWARRGYDWRDVLAQQKLELDELNKLGLQFGNPASKTIKEDDATPDGKQPGAAGGNPDDNEMAKAARVNRVTAKKDANGQEHDDDGKFGTGSGSKKTDSDKEGKDKKKDDEKTDHGHGEGRDSTGAKKDAKPGQRYREIDSTTTHEGVKKERAKELSKSEAKDAVKWHDGMTMVGKNEANAKLPDAARPELSDGERGALQKYSYKNDRVLNSHLRGNDKAIDNAPYNDKFYDEMHSQMQSAFAKAKPFDKPVTVVRGMKLDDETLKAFVGKLDSAQKEGGSISFSGYTSTAAPGGLAYKLGLDSGIPKSFRGNVSLTIAATHGLDMSPHSQLPGEKEFLLNHDSKFSVKKVTKKGDEYHVELEQIAPKNAKAQRNNAISAADDSDNLTKDDRDLLDFYDHHPDRWGRWVDHDDDFVTFSDDDAANKDKTEAAHAS